LIAALFTLVGVFALIRVSGPPTLGVMAVAVLLLLANVPTTIIVGRDGLHGRWLWTRFTISLRAVRAIELRFAGVVLRYADESAGLVAIQPRARAEALRDELARRLVVLDRAREEEALARELRRSGRTFEQWLADARAIGRDGGTYRAAAAPRAALWRIVESAVAAEEERVGAAVALATDQESRARVGEVARATAGAALREALEAIADGDELEERGVRALRSE
jgi:hypothetical protein